MRRKDGKFVGNIDMINGKPTYVTRREKKHIFRKYGKNGSFGLSRIVISDLLRAKVKFHKDIQIIFKYGHKDGFNFITTRVYKVSLTEFLKKSLVPPLSETENDPQRVMSIGEMEWE